MKWEMEMSATSSVSDSDFDERVLSASGPVLVDFWAPWCGPCKALAPTLETLAGEYDGKLSIVKLDVDDNPASRDRFGVRGIPMLALYSNGSEVARVTGAQSRARLTAFLDLHLGTETVVEQAAAHQPALTFGADEQVRDRCVERLTRHMAAGSVRPGPTSWDGEAGSALGCATEAGTPEECAAVIGVPASIVGLVDTLSTYYGTVVGGSEFALGWIRSVPVGVTLSDMPLRLLSTMLESGVIEREVKAHPAAREVRDAIMAAHRASVNSTVGNAEWAALRARAKSLEDQIPIPLAELLESAGYPLDDAEVLRAVLLSSSMIHMAIAMRDYDWSKADEERANEHLKALHAKPKQEGADNRSIFETFRKQDSELADRFAAASKYRGDMMREAGQIVGLRLQELTTAAAREAA